MKEAIDIIRHRWREVAVILALGIVSEIRNLLMAWARLLMPETSVWSSLTMSLIAASGLIIIVIALIYFGFFRSIAINAFETRQIRSLLSTGKAFFWRLFVVQVLFDGSVFAISYVSFLLLKAALNLGGYRLDSFSHAVWWARGSCWMIAYVLLAVPYVLAACFIIVRDCSEGQSLKGIFSVRLADSNLVTLAIGAAILQSIWVFVPFETAATVTFRIIHIPYDVLVSLTKIFIAVFTVRMLVAQMGWSQRPDKAHETAT